MPAMKSKGKTKAKRAPRVRGFHGDRVRVAPLWMSSAGKAALYEAAKKDGTNVSEYVRRAIEEKIERGRG